MRKLRKYENHKCCPEEWRRVSDLTGNFELDGMIQRTPNRDMARKLEDHLITDVAYQKRTAYNGSSLD